MKAPHVIFHFSPQLALFVNYSYSTIFFYFHANVFRGNTPILKRKHENYLFYKMSINKGDCSSFTFDFCPVHLVNLRQTLEWVFYVVMLILLLLKQHFIISNKFLFSVWNYFPNIPPNFIILSLCLAYIYIFYIIYKLRNDDKNFNFILKYSPNTLLYLKSMTIFNNIVFFGGHLVLFKLWGILINQILLFAHIST